MALKINHTKVSAIPDGADTSLVLPSDWNADHALVGVADITQGGTGLGVIGANGTVLQSNGTTASWQALAGNLTGKTQAATPFITALGTGASGTATGTNGTYVGYNAGSSAGTGNYNTVMGSDSFNSATSAANNTVMGYQAGKTMATGTANTLVGSQAGRLSTGNNNTFVGANAGELNTGLNNTFIGAQCGANATTIGSSVCIGNSNLQTATNAADGTVSIGYASCDTLSTAAGTTAVGWSTGTALTTGSRNTYFGYDAGRVNATSNDNTFMGYQAGRLVTAAGNTLIGSGAGVVITTGANNTIIGAYPATGAPTLTGAVILADGAGTTRFYSSSTGSIAFVGGDFGLPGQVLKSKGSGTAANWTAVNATNYRTITAATASIGGSDDVAFVNATSNNIALTIPSAVLFPGQQYTVKRIDSVGGNTVTITAAGGNIEGAASQTIGIGVGVIYCSDGTNWWELSNS